MDRTLRGPAVGAVDTLAPMQSSPARRDSLTVALLAVAAVAGIVVRVLVWRSSYGQYDGDEAVWGLMARHALHGDFASFFWGQGYGGTLEVALTAGVFGIFGTSWWAARLVPIILTAIAALLVWRVGRRTIGEPAARFAAAIFWVFPAYLVWKSIRAHGFYGSGLVLALLVLLLVLRLAERRSLQDTAFLGLVIGVGFWQTAQIVAIVVPAVIWLTVRRPVVWRDAWIGVVPALLGALPWLLSNLRHGWWSFDMTVTGAPSYVGRLRGFGSGTLPMVLDLRLPFSSQWIGGKLLSGAVYVVLLGLLVAVGWRMRRTNVALLVLLVIMYPFVYSVSQYTWLFDEPRYIVLAIPATTLLLSLPLTTARRGAIGIAVALALTVTTFVRLDPVAYRLQADGHLVPRDFAPLVAELDRRQIRQVYGHYWIVYRLSFESRERIVAAEADLDTLSERRPGAVLPQEPQGVRWPRYDAAARRVEAPAWVFTVGSPRDLRWRPLFTRLGYTRTEVGGFSIYAKGAASTRVIAAEGSTGRG